jgi:hypothetical protein
VFSTTGSPRFVRGRIENGTLKRAARDIYVKLMLQSPTLPFPTLNSDKRSHERGKTATSPASACQCLGCGRRRPLRMSEA